jgi:hypothetical protein
MGRGKVKQKNNLKKQYLKPLREYCIKLEQENEILKSDPKTAIGSFIGQLREIYSQNGRLSALSACLLQKLGGTCRLTKTELEAFAGNKIHIDWKLPEGVTDPNQAEYYDFTFRLVPDAPPVAAQPEEDLADTIHEAVIASK